MDIKWQVRLSYTDLGENHTIQYTVNARNKDTADNIAKEIFLTEHGVCSRIYTSVEPVHLSSDDIKMMFDIKEKVFDELDKSCRGKDYKAFINSFLSFDGFNANIGGTDSYFWLKFNGLTVKMVYSLSLGCYLDTKDIFYKSKTGKKIAVRNSWTEFYYMV